MTVTGIPYPRPPTNCIRGLFLVTRSPYHNLREPWKVHLVTYNSRVHLKRRKEKRRGGQLRRGWKRTRPEKKYRFTWRFCSNGTWGGRKGLLGLDATARFGLVVLGRTLVQGPRPPGEAESDDTSLSDLLLLERLHQNSPTRITVGTISSKQARRTSKQDLASHCQVTSSFSGHLTIIFGCTDKISNTSVVLYCVHK